MAETTPQKNSSRKRYQLVIKICACPKNCGRSWLALKESKNEYFSATHEPGNKFGYNVMPRNKPGRKPKNKGYEPDTDKFPDEQYVNDW